MRDPLFWRRFEPAAMLFRAAQEQMIGAALAGLFCSQRAACPGAWALVSETRLFAEP
jgi:hypothetical protein